MKKLSALFIIAFTTIVSCDNKNSSTVGYYEDPKPMQHSENKEEAKEEHHSTEMTKTIPADTMKTGMHSDTMKDASH